MFPVSDFCQKKFFDVDYTIVHGTHGKRYNKSLESQNEFVRTKDKESKNYIRM